MALLFIQLRGDRCDFFLSEVANKFSARPLLIGKTEVDHFIVSSQPYCLSENGVSVPLVWSTLDSMIDLSVIGY